jgi:hypothetical protein
MIGNLRSADCLSTMVASTRGATPRRLHLPHVSTPRKSNHLSSCIPQPASASVLRSTFASAASTAVDAVVESRSNSGLDFGLACAQGPRDTMEDELCVIPDFGEQLYAGAMLPFACVNFPPRWRVHRCVLDEFMCCTGGSALCTRKCQTFHHVL